MQLNHMQQVAVEKFYDFYKYPGRRKRPWFEIDGPAGTGKTTVVREAVKNLDLSIDDQIAFMAYVGKATLALRKNGLNAYTIHKLIYDLVKCAKVDELGNYVMKNGLVQSTYKFELKDKLEKPYKILVGDEAGMIGDRIGEDILSFGIPTMLLGDNAQLPPVMAKRMFLIEPDVSLNEIMRQAKDSPIIYLSQRAKNNMKIHYGTYGDNECIVIPREKLTDEHLAEADIVICETNSTRDVINRYIRSNIYDIHENYIVPGDKLICRQNKWFINLDKDVSLVNGLIGYVENTHKESTHSGCKMDIDFRPEFYKRKYFRQVGINHNYPFLPYANRKDVNPMSSQNCLFEFGYAITCHLAQGSQYDTVLVYVERGGYNSLYFRQWLYTAITRAVKKLILVI